jgi:hypothetical protein
MVCVWRLTSGLVNQEQMYMGRAAEVRLSKFTIRSSEDKFES